MLAVKLKELRKTKKLTQVEFAKIFNISSGTIAMWETSKRTPDTDTLISIADYFGVSLDYLLGRKALTSNANVDIFKDTKNKLIESLKMRNINIEDLNKLTPDDINMLLSLLEKFIKEKK